jgi:hypothetical protein
MSNAQKFKELAKKKASSPEAIEKFNKEWVQDVNELMGKISGWLTDEDISHEAREKDYDDPIIGTFNVKVIRMTMGGLEDVRIRPNIIMSSFPNLELTIVGRHAVRIARCPDRKWTIGNSTDNVNKNNFFDTLTYACGLED